MTYSDEYHHSAQIIGCYPPATWRWHLLLFIHEIYELLILKIVSPITHESNLLTIGIIPEFINPMPNIVNYTVKRYNFLFSY